MTILDPGPGALESDSSLDGDRDNWALNIQQAIQNDDILEVEQLLKVDGGLERTFSYHFPGDSSSTTRITPFLLAAALGRCRLVKEILQQGVDVNSQTTWDGLNAFHLAAGRGHIDVMQLLLETGGVDLLNLGTSGSLPALLPAAENGHLAAVDYLIERGVDVTARWRGFNAFHLAAINGHTDIMKTILEARKDLLELRARHGATALILAAEHGHLAVVEYLIRSGAKIGATTDLRRTALHVACFNGRDAICETILRGLYQSQTDNGSNAAKTLITMKDFRGDTPLGDAAARGHVEIVLKLLGTPVFFPYSPARDEVFLTDKSDADEAEGVLLGWVNNANPEEVEQHQQAVIYWALLNGRDSLIPVESLPELNREGASWAHVAALAGNVNQITQLLGERKDVLARDKKGITPLHLATKHGHSELVEHLLTFLSQGSGSPQGNLVNDNDNEGRCEHGAGADDMNILDAMLTRTDEEATPLSFASIGTTEKHRDIENMLWGELRRIITRVPEFFVQHPKKAGLVLELAAQFDTPGQETNLHMLFQLMRRGSSELPQSFPASPGEGWNALDLAVYYQYPIVIWWLLANGGYTSESDIRHARNINGQLKSNRANAMIQHLLSDPPPIVESRAPRDNDYTPSFQSGPPEHDNVWGAILDFYDTADHVDFRLKRRQTSVMIYKDGPQKIMSDDKYRELSSLKESPFDSYLKSIRASSRTGSGLSETTQQHTLRWIHIPVNDLHAVEELMVRISKDENKSNKEHRPLANFVQKSWAQLPAGGRKVYMKPQCVSEDWQFESAISRQRTWQSQDKSEGDNQQTLQSNRRRRVAIYMPYISWVEWPLKQREPEDQKLNSQMIEPIGEHKPMTLDQYYYVSLDDTDERDRDQVLGRYITRERDRNVNTQTAPRAGDRAGKPSQSVMANQRTKDTRDQILVVNQLWLWTLDDGTIVTSTTREPPDSDNTFMQHMLNALKSQNKNSGLLLESMTELILSTAISLLEKKQISISGTRKSPLEVFRDSIRLVRNEEAELFRKFQESLKPEGKNGADTETQYNRTSTADQENVYHDIADETRLLQEVKDICDELNILKNLTEDQERVWRQVCELKGSSNALSTYNTPTNVKEQILEMIKEAEVVQKSIDTLLDLKQKQANLMEAKSARQQAQDTAKQTDTIVIFTVVTIVFLPLSFLTSLFSLNISNFPHQGDNVAYRGSWIFPILFGVSIIVSGFFMTVAFKANTLKRALPGAWKLVIQEAKNTFRGLSDSSSGRRTTVGNSEGEKRAGDGDTFV